MLGLISFFVNLLESTGFFDLVFSAFKEPDEIKENPHEVTIRRIMIFELVHIALFVLSIFYIAICVISYWLTQRTWTKYERFERKGEDQVYRDSHTLHLEWKRAGWKKIYSWRLLWKLTSSNEEIQYFAARSRFVQLNNLEPKFRMDIYLKHQLQHLFFELIEINWKIWLGVFTFAILNWIRVKYTDDPTTSMGRLKYGISSWLFIGVLGYGTLISATAVLIF